MNKSLLAAFEREISKIKDYIEYIARVGNLAEQDEATISVPTFDEFKKHFLNVKTDKKILEYKAIMISLYGLLEYSIELWVHEYLDIISKLIPYKKQSDVLKGKHFELSLKLMSIVIEGRWDKYAQLKKEDILKNLHNCIESEAEYKFNSHAFTIQSGNLKHKRIEEIFSNIGIPVTERLKKNHILNNILSVDISIASRTSASTLYGKLDDIVERRNRVAHGAEVDDLLGLTELGPYADFLSAYCTAIFGVLEQEILKLGLVEKHEKVELIDVFNKSSEYPVLWIDVGNQGSISVGETIIIETAEGHFYKKKITSLRVNDVDEQSFEAGEEANLTICFNNEEREIINTNCKCYIEK